MTVCRGIKNSFSEIQNQTIAYYSLNNSKAQNSQFEEEY